MSWLQDYNWPVAHVLAPFLRGMGPVDPLVAVVRAILDGDDSVWKYHVLYQVVDGWDARGIARIASQLERLAGTPHAGDVAGRCQSSLTAARKLFMRLRLRMRG
jgi:hypothetical protein